MSFARTHLDEAKRIIDNLDVGVIDRMAEALAALRERGGRLFFLGVGGSAGNCSHAVNDFRKLAGIEAYAPTDNVSELTARTNDEGWETVFAEWLKHAAFAGRPWRSFADVLWHHFESVGTKAYTARELDALFAAFAGSDIVTYMTPYDLQHWPPSLARWFPQHWGMFSAIRAVK